MRRWFPTMTLRGPPTSSSWTWHDRQGPWGRRKRGARTARARRPGEIAVRNPLEPGVVAVEAWRASVRRCSWACGEIDVVGDPWSEPSAYRSSHDVTVCVFSKMAHMHNFAPTREHLWRRLAARGPSSLPIPTATREPRAHLAALEHRGPELSVCTVCQTRCAVSTASAIASLNCITDYSPNDLQGNDAEGARRHQGDRHHCVGVRALGRRRFGTLGR